jgi:hypothetical protein
MCLFIFMKEMLWPIQDSNVHGVPYAGLIGAQTAHNGLSIVVYEASIPFLFTSFFLEHLFSTLLLDPYLILPSTPLLYPTLRSIPLLSTSFFRQYLFINLLSGPYLYSLPHSPSGVSIDHFRHHVMWVRYEGCSTQPSDSSKHRYGIETEKSTKSKYFRMLNSQPRNY